VYDKQDKMMEAEAIFQRGLKRFMFRGELRAIFARLCFNSSKPIILRACDLTTEFGMGLMAFRYR
jgi:hypothetical protein